MTGELAGQVEPRAVEAVVRLGVSMTHNTVNPILVQGAEVEIEPERRSLHRSRYITLPSQAS